MSEALVNEAVMGGLVMSETGAVREELVVLLDELGEAVGTAPKATVHGPDTPLHLAFSCYVFKGTSVSGANSDGATVRGVNVDGASPHGEDTRREDEVLLTQRALTKATWPGVWTNAACGHPAPGENLVDAVTRRVGEELGVTLSGVRLLLPRFRYRAQMENGTVEHEMCPVFMARCEGPLHPDPAEVAEAQWVPWRDFADAVRHGRRQVSPWCAEQVAGLRALGERPSTWREGSWDALPPAARDVTAAGTEVSRS